MKPAVETWKKLKIKLGMKTPFSLSLKDLLMSLPYRDSDGRRNESKLRPVQTR